MKKTFVITLSCTLLLATFACRKKGEMPQALKVATEALKDTTTIEFVDSVKYNFDTANEGDLVKHTFRIKNTGNKNLMILEAHGSCGCTVPDYPKEPIKPGEIAPINVTFNSEGRTNDIMKTVTVQCNTVKRFEVLQITGFVRPKDKK